MESGDIVVARGQSSVVVRYTAIYVSQRRELNPSSYNKSPCKPAQPIRRPGGVLALRRQQETQPRFLQHGLVAAAPSLACLVARCTNSQGDADPSATHGWELR